jgi:hypothetical protein
MIEAMVMSSFDLLFMPFMIIKNQAKKRVFKLKAHS